MTILRLLGRPEEAEGAAAFLVEVQSSLQALTLAQQIQLVTHRWGLMAGQFHAWRASMWGEVEHEPPPAWEVWPPALHTYLQALRSRHLHDEMAQLRAGRQSGAAGAAAVTRQSSGKGAGRQSSRAAGQQAQPPPQQQARSQQQLPQQRRGAGAQSGIAAALAALSARPAPGSNQCAFIFNNLPCARLAAQLPCKFEH